MSDPPPGPSRSSSLVRGVLMVLLLAGIFAGLAALDHSDPTGWVLRILTGAVLGGLLAVLGERRRRTRSSASARRGPRG